MRAAIAISIAFHVALFVWLQQQPEPPTRVTRPVPPPASAPVPMAVVDPEPLTVALLDDHTVPVASIDPGLLHHTTKSAPGKRQPTTALAVATTGTTTLLPETEKPTHSSLMVMRRPEIDHSSVGGAIASLAGVPQWGEVPTEDQIVAEREAIVRRRYEQNHAELKSDGTGTKTEHNTFKMKFNGDGTVKEIKDKANWQQKSLFHAEFDITDAMMRRQGIDPYSSYKKKILDETREQRFEMGTQYRTQQLAQSRHFMQKNLERLLASTTSRTELKQGLFELWDDCAETGSEELVAGGKAAREQVMGYITSKFPATSADAYSADELAQLNKRRKSKLTFAPYGG